MKITPHDYATMSKALDTLKADMPKYWKEYQDKGLTVGRFRWDCFFAVNPDGMRASAWICKQLYSYLNDSHIETAIKHWFNANVPTIGKE
jgi:hypothetical protein